jgi:hypothetical protein
MYSRDLSCAAPNGFTLLKVTRPSSTQLSNQCCGVRVMHINDEGTSWGGEELEYSNVD